MNSQEKLTLFDAKRACNLVGSNLAISENLNDPSEVRLLQKTCSFLSTENDNCWVNGADRLYNKFYTSRSELFQSSCSYFGCKQYRNSQSKSLLSFNPLNSVYQFATFTDQEQTRGILNGLRNIRVQQFDRAITTSEFFTIRNKKNNNKNYNIPLVKVCVYECGISSNPNVIDNVDCKIKTNECYVKDSTKFNQIFNNVQTYQSQNLIYDGEFYKFIEKYRLYGNRKVIYSQNPNECTVRLIDQNKHWFLHFTVNSLYYEDLDNDNIWGRSINLQGLRYNGQSHGGFFGTSFGSLNKEPITYQECISSGLNGCRAEFEVWGWLTGDPTQDWRTIEYDPPNCGSVVFYPSSVCEDVDFINKQINYKVLLKKNQKLFTNSGFDKEYSSTNEKKLIKRAKCMKIFPRDVTYIYDYKDFTQRKTTGTLGIDYIPGLDRFSYMPAFIELTPVAVMHYDQIVVPNNKLLDRNTPIYFTGFLDTMAQGTTIDEYYVDISNLIIDCLDCINDLIGIFAWDQIKYSRSTWLDEFTSPVQVYVNIFINNQWNKLEDLVLNDDTFKLFLHQVVYLQNYTIDYEPLIDWDFSSCLVINENGLESSVCLNQKHNYLCQFGKFIYI